jgi:transcription initiation factor IIE alpha subunit
MALSKCGSCGNGFFEMVEKEPSGSNYKKMFIQCSICGVPIGVTDYYDNSSQIKNLEAKVEKLEKALSQIDHNIRVIAGRL